MVHFVRSSAKRRIAAPASDSCGRPAPGMLGGCTPRSGNVVWAVQPGPVHRADITDLKLEVFRQPFAGRQSRVLRDGVHQCDDCWRRLVRRGAVSIEAVLAASGSGASTTASRVADSRRRCRSPRPLLQRSNLRCAG